MRPPLVILTLILFASMTSACGVKGPPLPPLRLTPERADNVELRSLPSPIPSMAPAESETEPDNE